MKTVIPLLALCTGAVALAGACEPEYQRQVDGLSARVGFQALTLAYFRHDRREDNGATTYRADAVEIATVRIGHPDEPSFQVVTPELEPTERIASAHVAIEGVNEWVLFNVVGDPIANAEDPEASVGAERAPLLVVNGGEPQRLLTNEGEPIRACHATIHALPDDTAVIALRAGDGRVRLVRVNAGLRVQSNRALGDLAIHGAGACERAGDGIALANFEGTFVVFAPADDLSDAEADVIPSAGVGAYVGPLDGSGEVTLGYTEDGTPQAAWILVEPGPPTPPDEPEEVIVTTRAAVRSAAGKILVTDGTTVLDGGTAPVCLSATFDTAGRALLLGASDRAVFYKERDGELVPIRMPGSARGSAGCAIDYQDNRPRLMWVREERSTGELRSLLAYYTVESNLAVSLLPPVKLTPDRIQDRPPVETPPEGTVEPDAGTTDEPDAG